MIDRCGTVHCRPCDRTGEDLDIIYSRLKNIKVFEKFHPLLLQQICYYGYYEDLERGVTCEWLLWQLFGLYYVSPPLGETYCFCPVRLSVCPSIRLSVCHTSFPLNNSSTLSPRAFKLHRVIALIE